MTIWCLSVLIMVAVAVFEKNWRMLHIWLGLIVCCLAPVFIFGQKESIRWLIIAGKESRAESILSSVSVPAHVEADFTLIYTLCRPWW